MNFPEKLLYSKEHTWLKVDGNKGYIGISDFAQDELGDIVYVELPEEDDEIEQGVSFGNVESVKTVSELFGPISGKVLEVNEELEDEPDIINTSPYEKGWMLVVEMTSKDELDNLLSAEEYKQSISKDE